MSNNQHSVSKSYKSVTEVNKSRIEKLLKNQHLPYQKISSDSVIMYMASGVGVVLRDETELHTEFIVSISKETGNVCMDFIIIPEVNREQIKEILVGVNVINSLIMDQKLVYEFNGNQVVLIDSLHTAYAEVNYSYLEHCFSVILESLVHVKLALEMFLAGEISADQIPYILAQE